MTTTIQSSGKASSIPGGMAIAGAVSMTITLFVSAAIAYFLNTQKITWEQAGYWILGMLFAASFLGAKSGFRAIKRQRLAVSIMSGVLYWALLLTVTALFFGGQFQALGVTAAVIGAGSGTAALLPGANRKKGKGKIRKAYR